MPTVKFATPVCGDPACVQSNEAAVGLRKQAKHEFRNVACAFSMHSVNLLIKQPLN